MFAPRPQTHQISRHYNVHTTAKKNQNKENVGGGGGGGGRGLPSKTPSRAGVGKMLAPNTAAPTRMGGGDKDGKDKGKGKGVDEIAPKRLFTNNAPGGMSTSRSFGGGLNHSQPLSYRTTKTPARAPPVLRSPGPALAAQTPLPSASKPRRSSRRSSSISLTPQFATPAPKQKHWDEGDSLGSMTEGLNELAIGQGPTLDEVAEEEEDGEPEYMPPRAEPLPWEPVGAIPSVVEDVRTMLTLPPLWAMAVDQDDIPPLPELEPPSIFNPDLCDDDELEEPIFRSLAKPPAPLITIKNTAPTPKQTLSLKRPAVPTSRPTPATSRITKPPVPRLGARSVTPASTINNRRSTHHAGHVFRPVVGQDAAVSMSNAMDMGLLGDTTPILFDDLDFGFDSDEDFGALHTP